MHLKSALAGVLAVGMGGSAWAATPTISSQVYYDLLMAPVNGQQYYATVTGVIGVFPGPNMYGNGDYKCYVSGTIVSYPGIESTDAINLTYTSKNATSGTCPDYAKFGALTINLNFPNLDGIPPIQDWELLPIPPAPVPHGEMFWVTIFNNDMETSVPQQDVGDYQGFMLLPQSINLLQLYGSAQVYLASGLANTIGF